MLDLNKFSFHKDNCTIVPNFTSGIYSNHPNAQNMNCFNRALPSGLLFQTPLDLTPLAVPGVGRPPGSLVGARQSQS